MSNRKSIGVNSIGQKSATVKISKWQTLKNRLESGTLLKSLTSRKDSNDSRNSSIQLSGAGSGIGLGFKSVKYQGGSSTSVAGGKFNAKLLILEAKSQHEATKKKQKERALRRHLLKKQRKLETQLEYLNFPTIMGFYFDGFFTPHFQLNAEYAAIFNELEKEIATEKQQAYKETFTEMAKRNFWPPRIIAGYFFRTKGVYLDFKEILKDPPHTPPDIVTDPRTKAITVFVTNDETYDENENESKVASWESIHEKQGMTITQFDRKYGKDDSGKHTTYSKQTIHEQLDEETRFKNTTKNSFYFDDSIPGFFRKRPQDNDRYFYDSQFDVWRIKRHPITFANDFFFDDVRGMFLPKDRTRSKDAYFYCPADGCYREAGEIGPTNWRGLEPKQFYWNEFESKWKRTKLAPKDVKVTYDKNANRNCFKNLKVKTPDDYYFDTVNLTYVLKGTKGSDYYYDYDFGAWRNKNDPNPQKTVTNPSDFYWNDVDFTFKKRDAPSAFFAYDSNNRFFRKNKSVRGKFHPKNWVWNEKTKTWNLKKSNRSSYFSESLHWRPDRDYEKPWLEYVGGLRKSNVSYFVGNSDEDSDDEKTPQGKKLTHSASEPLKSTSGLGTSEPLKSTSGLGTEYSKTSEATSPKPEPKPGKEPDPKALKEPVPAISINDASEKQSEVLERKKTIEQAEMIVVADLYDMKILKITNLGVVVTDSDLKAYFASVKKVVRPKVPGTNLTESYAYCFFHTEEAAAAAMKIMHNQTIKGQTIKISYKLKDEDPEKGEVKKPKKK